MLPSMRAGRSSGRSEKMNMHDESRETEEPPLPQGATPLLRFILRGGEIPGGDELTAQESEDFAAHLAFHGLVPIAYERIRHLALDARLRSRLREKTFAEAAAEELRERDLLELAAHWPAGLPGLVMKGSALAYQIYQQPHLRPRSDHDLLIEWNDLPNIRELFLSLGYEEESTGGQLITSQTLFVREGEASSVFDVHWRPSNVHAVSRALSFGELIAASTPHPRFSSLRVPSLEDSLLIALLHRAAHHHDSERLIWLADIDLLCRTLGDERVASVVERARGRGAGSVCIRGLQLTRQYFGTPLPALPDVDRDRLNWLNARRAKRVEMFLRDLQALPGWRARRRWLRELAFPTESFMRKEFARGHESLARLYLRRGVRGLKRLFRPTSS
jgi:hypothetical protein